MAKKRKASGRSIPKPEGPDLDVGESKRRIKDYRDVADSDDEFHDARDQVLLDDGPDAKRRRKWEDEEEFLQPSDEEVLGYSESDDEEDIQPSPKATQRKSRANGVEDSDDDVATKQAHADDDDERLGWGTSRADFYGADAIETEEQALEEEAEALRLQKKQLQSMTAADYGFDESDWQQNGDAADSSEAKADDGTVTEILPPIQIPADMNADDRLKILKSRYPEFEPLSQELIRMKKVHTALVKEDRQNRPNATTKARAAYAYLGTLIMYFALLASPAWNGSTDAIALSANKIREHAVMDNLVQSRILWQKASQLPDDKSFEVDSDVDVDVESPVGEDSLAPAAPLQTKPRMSRAERHAAAARAAAEAKRQDRLKRTEADLADLDALIADAAKRRTVKKASAADVDSDLGDEAPLTAFDLAEKANKKKSLRFYTSQIAQKANKRGASGRNAGGDEDIPYRERWRDRQARLNAEAEKRGRPDIGDDLGGESDEDDARQAKQIRAAADPRTEDHEDDYYDMVAARTAKKKSDKTALAAAQKEAALKGGRVVEEETVGADGKRKITYAIEKNKGLTPFRKKDVRNPRVKKRKKYDEKKKKLASIKPVYKGGEGRGGYGGELTGIKKGLVKSTKL